MSTEQKALILTEKTIEQKLNRMAYQIYEQNYDAQNLIICGISERGFRLAKKIYHKLQDISEFNLELTKLSINKRNPSLENIKIDPPLEEPEKKVVILCDDVLYTGKTMIYASLPFLNANVQKLECLVLINRHHLLFPLHAVYTGLSLATTIQEHVSVNWDKQEVWLK